MYDFWYAFGATVMKPSILTDIQNSSPVFTFLKRITVEVSSDGSQELRPDPIHAGVLEHIATERVRNQIAKSLASFSGNAPAVSIYSAGRFSQLINIKRFSSGLPKTSTFTDIVMLANQAYSSASKGKPVPVSPAFPALVGALLMDGKLADKVDKQDASITSILAEFKVTFGSGPDWDIAHDLVGQQPFKDASFLLMASDENPWSARQTMEQVFFWDGFSEHAVP